MPSSLRLKELPYKSRTFFAEIRLRFDAEFPLDEFVKSKGFSGLRQEFDSPGIYAMFDESGCCLYVGSTIRSIATRVCREHMYRSEWLKGKDLSKITLAISLCDDPLKHELLFIYCFSPLFNNETFDERAE